jgi:hypothetical protein
VQRFAKSERAFAWFTQQAPFLEANLPNAWGALSKRERLGLMFRFHLDEEAINTPLCPPQDKFHTSVLRESQKYF